MGARLVISPEALHVIIVLTAGIVIGFRIRQWLLRRRLNQLREGWEDLAYYHEQHADRLEQDDTRLGINTGITYATNRMKSTIDELEQHIEDHTP